MKSADEESISSFKPEYFFSGKINWLLGENITAFIKLVMMESLNHRISRG